MILERVVKQRANGFVLASAVLEYERADPEEMSHVWRGLALSRVVAMHSYREPNGALEP